MKCKLQGEGFKTNKTSPYLLVLSTQYLLFSFEIKSTFSLQFLQSQLHYCVCNSFGSLNYNTTIKVTEKTTGPLFLKSVSSYVIGTQSGLKKEEEEGSV